MSEKPKLGRPRLDPTAPLVHVAVYLPRWATVKLAEKAQAKAMTMSQFLRARLERLARRKDPVR